MVNLSITRRAETELRSFLQKENLPLSTLLRIGVEGGGCCEIGFGLSLETRVPGRNDEIATAGDFTFVIDHITAKHLEDSEIDFTVDDLGARFLFHQLKPAVR
jgi:iron-sulfur cluster assembly accessory protein